MALYLHILTVVAVCVAQLYVCQANGVTDFKDWASFESDVLTADYSLVDFFAPWCPHCKTLTPVIAKVGEMVDNGDLKDKVRIAKVDCTSKQGEVICKQNRVTGYPTLRIYNQKKFFEEYNGARTPDAMLEYLKTIVKKGKPQFTGKNMGDQQPMCMAADYYKYVKHKS